MPPARRNAKKRAHRLKGKSTKRRTHQTPGRKLMRQAIAEMLLSRSEHAGKTDPLVGAVLVSSSGKIIGRAHRGKYGTGDHGEFTLLEKSVVKITPASTLYVTLEPCTKRGVGKKPCADRVITAGIRNVVIGIRDPNPQIFGKGIERLKQAGVNVEFFDEDLAKEISRENDGFIKDQESKAQAIRTAQLKSPDREETRPVNESSVSDFSESAIRLYLNKTGKKYRIPSNELWTDFRKAGFLVVGNNKKDLIPTVAGIVLFGKEPHQFLPQARIKADQYPGSPSEAPSLERSTAQKDITGPLLEQVEGALAFFNKNVRKVPRSRGAIREEAAEYPEQVIREAVVNAVVHRSYGTSVHTFVQMYRDQIVLKSPGLPVEPLTIEMFPDDVTPIARNPKIAQAAFEMGFMEARGYGVKNMPERLREYGLREPAFTVDKGNFVLTLYGRETTPFRIRADQQLLAALTPRQLDIVELTENNKVVRSEDVTKTFRISKETASQDFKRLMELKILGRTGTGRSTSYFLLRS